MNVDLDDHLEEARRRIAEAADEAALRAVERAYVDKGGVVAEMLASIPGLPPEDRKAVGVNANRLKTAIQEALEARRSELADAELEARRGARGFDPTVPGTPQRRGSLHPLTQLQRHVEDVFTSMGYLVLDGPEVELDEYNFQKLNIPADHPAREMQDTFWCDRDQHLVLRTHTSPVQIRAMEQLEPPFRTIVPGRVFRNEELDATHSHTFHQVEGLCVAEGVAVGHLVMTLRTALREVLMKDDLDVRLRPGYFPFVEPGFELDVRCPFCADGCRICKHTTWIEFCGCGMVHPNVLRAGGIDPERFSGFAFGFGLDRLAMMWAAIDDVRHFLEADLRFLEQF